jgi:hypothetical protein
MQDWVVQWVQEGRLWVWQYAEPKQSWRGWHLSADPAGCRSVRDLLDRMSGGKACHRTLQLDPVTDAVLRVPNYNRKCRGHFTKLRIEFDPDHADLTLAPGDGRLFLTVGNHRLRKLTSAFAAVEAGAGDFDIKTADSKQAEPWMFWWPPGFAE